MTNSFGCVSFQLKTLAKVAKAASNRVIHPKTFARVTCLNSFETHPIHFNLAASIPATSSTLTDSPSAFAAPVSITMQKGQPTASK